MRALKLRNLPEIIKPTHITHILTRRGNPLAPPKDAGITMIEIYTIPRKRKRKTPRSLQCSIQPESTASKSDSPLPVPQNSPAAPGQPTQLIHTSQGRGPAPQVQLHQPQIAQEEEETHETIAYVHFRRDYQLHRAKALMERMTIDGRRVQVTEKRWNAGVFRRLWAKSGIPDRMSKLTRQETKRSAI